MSLLGKKEVQDQTEEIHDKKRRERYISFVFHRMDQEDFLPPRN
jgi:hypothetical protein